MDEPRRGRRRRPPRRPPGPASSRRAATARKDRRGSAGPRHPPPARSARPHPPAPVSRPIRTRSPRQSRSVPASGRSGRAAGRRRSAAGQYRPHRRRAERCRCAPRAPPAPAHAFSHVASLRSGLLSPLPEHDTLGGRERDPANSRELRGIPLPAERRQRRIDDEAAADVHPGPRARRRRRAARGGPARDAERERHHLRPRAPERDRRRGPQEDLGRVVRRQGGPGGPADHHQAAELPDRDDRAGAHRTDPGLGHESLRVQGAQHRRVPGALDRRRDGGGEYLHRRRRDAERLRDGSRRRLGGAAGRPVAARSDRRLPHSLLDAGARGTARLVLGGVRSPHPARAAGFRRRPTCPA